MQCTKLFLKFKIRVVLLQNASLQSTSQKGGIVVIFQPLKNRYSFLVPSSPSQVCIFDIFAKLSPSISVVIHIDCNTLDQRQSNKLQSLMLLKSANIQLWYHFLFLLFRLFFSFITVNWCAFVTPGFAKPS